MLHATSEAAPALTGASAGLRVLSDDIMEGIGPC